MVGEKFKAIRKAKGLTLEGTAKMLGIKSSGHLSMVERGDREPSDALVNNFKLTFSVSETWWETGEGEMFQAPDIEGLKMKNPSGVTSCRFKFGSGHHKIKHLAHTALSAFSFDPEFVVNL